MRERGFLSRWSQRKQSERAQEEARARAERARIEAEAEAARAAQAPPDPDAPPAISEAEAEQLSDAEILERLSLPDPAGIADGAQARAFLRDGVPKRLQKRALRRLWAVTPEQAAFDGLIDYAEDYTDAAVAVAELATTYQVGKGLRAHVEEMARQAEAAEAKAESARATLEDEGETGEGDAAETDGAVDPDAPAEPAPALARSYVRAPDSPSPTTFDQDNLAESDAPSAETANPDQNTTGRNAADAAPQKELGAAKRHANPRRLVFRFENE